MPAQESLIASTIRTRAVRVVVFCCLYLGIALGIAGVYVAGLAMATRAAFEAWGWIAAFAVLGLCFLCTALICWLATRLLSKSTSSAVDRNTAAASVAVAAHFDEPLANSAPTSLDDPRPGNLNSIVDSIGRLLTRRLSTESWIAPMAVGIATVAVVGPIRLLRIAVRAVRIARTLQLIARTAAASLSTSDAGARY